MMSSTSNMSRTTKLLFLVIFVLAVITVGILFTQAFYVVVFKSVISPDNPGVVELVNGFLMWESQDYSVRFMAVLITGVSCAAACTGLLRIIRSDSTSKYSKLVPFLGLAIALLDVAAYVFERNWQISEGWSSNAQWPGTGFIGVLVCGVSISAFGLLALLKQPGRAS